MVIIETVLLVLVVIGFTINTINFIKFKRDRS
jgi:hypothetical protein